MKSRFLVLATVIGLLGGPALADRVLFDISGELQDLGTSDNFLDGNTFELSIAIDLDAVDLNSSSSVARYALDVGSLAIGGESYAPAPNLSIEVINNALGVFDISIIGEFIVPGGGGDGSGLFSFGFSYIGAFSGLNPGDLDLTAGVFTGGITRWSGVLGAHLVRDYDADKTFQATNTKSVPEPSTLTLLGAGLLGLGFVRRRTSYIPPV